MGTQRPFVPGVEIHNTSFPGRRAQRGFHPYDGANIPPPPPEPPEIIYIPSPTFVAKGDIGGGKPFYLLYSNISVLGFVDSFAGIALDASKWTDISAGGTVSVDDGLGLSTPKAGGASGIRSVASWHNFDMSASFSCDNAAGKLFPSIEIVYFRLRARINSTNCFDVDYIWDPARGNTLRTSYTLNGVKSILSVDTGNYSARLLRLVRYNGRMLAYAGSKLLIDFSGWRTDAVNIELSNTCASSPVDISTMVSVFTPRIVVAFDDDICPQATEIVSRIVGVTPPSVLPGRVSVKAYSQNTVVDFGMPFEYVAPLQLTVGQSSGVSMIVNNDSTLRDSSATLTGLRL